MDTFTVAFLAVLLAQLMVLGLVLMFDGAGAS